MNATRLRTIIGLLIAAEEDLHIQKALTDLGAALNNFSNQPQDTNMQLQVSQKLDELRSRLVALQTKWEPVQLKDLASIGALPYFGEELATGIKESIANNAMTPAVVQRHVKQLQKNRGSYLEVLSRANSDLKTLGVGAEVLQEGAAEIGFRIPRALFDNDLDGLIKELRVLRRIMRAFSELSVDAAEPIQVRQISTSDPLFFFGLDPLTIAMLGGVVTWALDTWQRVLDIRKARAETRKLEVFTEEEVESIFSGKIRKTIEAEVEKKVAALIGSDKPTGRPAEQAGDLKWALNSMLARIERGMTVEIRFLPPPVVKEGDGEDVKATSTKEAFDTIKQVVPQLSFPAAEPDPVLELPSPKPPSHRAEEGDIPKKKRKIPSETEDGQQ